MNANQSPPPSSSFRVGHGYDAHRLVAGRALVVGGVAIDWHLGLDGHSDADVLLHAICDACLGAAGLGDLGEHFPSSQAQHQDADSRAIARRVQRMLADARWRVHNIDCTIVAQRPEMAPHIPRMRQRIADDLAIAVEQVNVKATTTDGLGFCGREQGIAAHAVALLRRDDS
ncbi:MAG: 2-C-methyl-D-erythritol 2,4-cyclodiphosphate synthase [bacterium]